MTLTSASVRIPSTTTPVIGEMSGPRCDAPGRTRSSNSCSVPAAANAPIAWATYAGHRYARELDTPDIGDALPFRREVTQLEPA